MPRRMEFDFTFGHPRENPNRSPEAETPLRILVLGNFSRRGPTPDAQPPLPQRPLVRIDIDRFDEVLRRFSPRWRLDEQGPAESSEELEFHELDDFRPERLGRKLTVFRQLQELRQKLLSPATFAQAAAQLRQELLAPASLPQGAEKPPARLAAPIEDDASTLQRLMGQGSTGGSAAAAARPADSSAAVFQRLIRQAVEPYIVPAADPHQEVYLAAVDNALGNLMRGVLHAPSFQALEATWLSLHQLISNLEDDSAIEIHLLDVTVEELMAEVPTDDEQLQQWSLYRRLTDDSAEALGTAPWSLIVGDFTIAARQNDLALLGALAAMAERLGAAVVTAAHSSLLGCPSLIDCLDPAQWQPLDAAVEGYWQTLRRSPAAAWAGLALPRVLLRLPYGKATDEVESFAFEEFSPARRHEDYLWGNPAYLCAGLIAQAFAEAGWSLQPGSQLDIGDLPAHTYREAGEARLQPCAETAFGERTAEAILQRGLMPLLSWKDRNAVRFVRFQSIADPLTPLAGPWS